MAGADGGEVGCGATVGFGVGTSVGFAVGTIVGLDVGIGASVAVDVGIACLVCPIAAEPQETRIVAAIAILQRATMTLFVRVPR